MQGNCTGNASNRDMARAVYAGDDLASELSDEEDEEHIKPLMPAEHRRLRVKLGPLRARSPRTSCRARLSVELARYAVLRVDEVAKVSRRKIIALWPDPDRPMGTRAVKVKLTKRLKPRVVRIPDALVE